MCTYYVPPTRISIFHVLTSSLFTTTPWSKYYRYPHYTDEEAKARKDASLSHGYIYSMGQQDLNLCTWASES